MSAQNDRHADWKQNTKYFLTLNLDSLIFSAGLYPIYFKVSNIWISHGAGC